MVSHVRCQWQLQGHRCLIFFSIIFSLDISAQNFFRNGGFEDSTFSAPTYKVNIQNNEGFNLIPSWRVPSKGTADYYNSNSSTIYGTPVIKAHNGYGRAGIIIGGIKWRSILAGGNYKEYLRNTLTTQLDSGKKYFVDFYYALDRSSRFTNDDVGIYFSADENLPKKKLTFDVTPQVASPKNNFICAQEGWVEVKGSFVATGKEKFATIGCFNLTDGKKLRALGMKRPKHSIFEPYRKFAYIFVDDFYVGEDSVIAPSTVLSPTTTSSGNNLVFLLDVSGSMNSPEKLDSLKKEMKKLVRTLSPADKISIVSFSATSQEILSPTFVSDQTTIDFIIDGIKANGSTNFSEGVKAAYQALNKMTNGSGKIIIATDGVFVIDKKIKQLVLYNAKKRRASLSCIQFGNKPNNELEKLCRATKGHYNMANENSLTFILSNETKTVFTNEKVEYTKPIPKYILQDIIIHRVVTSLVWLLFFLRVSNVYQF